MENAILGPNPFLYPMSLPHGRDSGRAFSPMGRRHYDPTVGRFLEPDSAQWLDPKRFGGINPYAYCLNDPIVYSDPDGRGAVLAGLIIGAVLGIGIGFGAVAYADYQNDGVLFNFGEGDPQWYDYLIGVVVGGLIGGALGVGAGYLSTLGWTFSLPSMVSSGGAAAIPLSVTVTGTEVLVGVLGLGLTGGLTMFSKHNPGMGNKPLPSYITREECIEAMIRNNGDSSKAATELMNNHLTNWHRGAGTDYNSIKKYLDRVIRRMLGL